MRLLIAGSMEWSRHTGTVVKDRVTGCVAHAKAHNWVLLIGDAKGVDTWALEAAYELGYDLNRVYVFCRNEARNHARCQVRNTDGKGNKFTSFTERDEYMVRLASIVYVFWNGHSKGSQHVYQYARGLGKGTLLDRGGTFTQSMPKKKEDKREAKAA